MIERYLLGWNVIENRACAYDCNLGRVGVRERTCAHWFGYLVEYLIPLS